jgi:hypothetical protein
VAAADHRKDDNAELLRRFQPCLRYDSLEPYFADSAELWTLNQGNRLRRADKTTIASVGDRLTLDFLRAGEYPGGAKVEPSDVVEADNEDYSARYLQLRRDNPQLRNVIYGHVAETAKGDWLQYWFYYFLNDYQLAWGAGVHEGDWEMVQYKLRPDRSEPETAVYAQHNFCQVKPWSEVRRLAEEKEEDGVAPAPGDGDRPLVYVGRGSHASFFTPGFHPTDFYDYTDGKRRPKSARLEIVDPPPGWCEWPGRWGGSRAGGKGPTGPFAHDQWSDPESLIRTAYQGEEEGELPDAPQIWARRRRNRLLLEFDFSPMPAPPSRLIATVNSSDEPDIPPRAFRFALRAVVRGTLQTRIELEAGKHYDISVAVIDEQGLPTSAKVFVLAPSSGLLGLRRRITSGFGRLVHLTRLAFGRA